MSLKSVNKISIFRFFLLLYLCAMFGNRLHTSVDLLLYRGSFILFIIVSLFCLNTYAGGQYRILARVSSYTIWELIFLVYLFLSYIWAADPNYVVNNHARVFGLLFAAPLCFFTIQETRTKEDIYALLNIILIASTYSAILLIIKTPASYWGSERIGAAIGVDRNGVGMNLAISSFIAFFLFFQTKKKLYLILCIPFIVVSFLTGSRKAFVIVVLTIGFYSTFRNRGIKIFRNILIAALAVWVIYLIVMNNDALYNVLGSRIETMTDYILNGNMTAETSSRQRSELKSYAMQLWFERPVLGWGFNNFQWYMAKINYEIISYSHCNFTELLSCLGLIGFCIFYSFYFFLGRKLWLLRKSDDPLVLFAVILFFVQIFIDYGSVSMVSQDVYFHLAIIYLIVRTETKSLSLQAVKSK